MKCVINNHEEEEIELEKTLIVSFVSWIIKEENLSAYENPPNLLYKCAGPVEKAATEWPDIHIYYFAM